MIYFNKQNILKKREVVVILLSVMPIIDTLNGYLISEYNNDSLIGKSYRLILIIMSLTFASKHGKVKLKHFKWLFLWLLYLSISSLLTLFLYDRVNGLGTITMYVFQWSMVLILNFCLINMSENNEFSIDEIDCIWSNWSVITPITIILPYVLNLGNFTYGSTKTGYKGFYYATNAISFLLILCFLYCLNEVLEGISLIKIIKLLLVIISILILGTKSGYIFCALYIISLVFYKYRGSIISNLRKVIIIASVIFSIVWIGRQILFKEISIIINRHLYFQNSSQNLLDFLTTGRTQKMELSFNILNDQNNLALRYIFGSGLSWVNKNKLIEMDFIDLFFSFGLLSLFIMICYLLFIFRNRIKTFDIYNIAFISALIYSFFGGHIFNNSLSASCFSLICVAVTTRRNKS